MSILRFVGGSASGDGRRRRIAMPHSLAVYREYGTEAGVEKHLVARLSKSIFRHFCDVSVKECPSRDL